MKEFLLTFNHVWWLAGATFYVGVITTVRLFLVPSWGTLRPDTVHDRFWVPIQAATRFFKIAVPTWMVAAIVLIVTEWGKPLEWTAVVSFVGLTISALWTNFMIFPLNRRIAAETDETRLQALLRRWVRFNDLRWSAVLVMWAALAWYFVAKPNLPAALKG